MAPRLVLGGVLMGLANLVPGISGGTMLLAAGVYPAFIDAIARVTRLRAGFEALSVLVAVVGSGLVAIVLLAGPVKDLVVDYRWVMYSLFIGLTLGGVPIVWELIGVARRRESRAAGGLDVAVWGGFAGGLAGMTALAVVQMAEGGGESASAGGGLVGAWLLMFVAGLAGASAMILPGVSGGYLLLVLGAYVPLLAGIDAIKSALGEGALGLLVEPATMIALPVGLGVVLGVAVVSNALKWLMEHYERATLGVLLGLLVGAVVGLWPFQQGVAPEPGTQFKGMTVAVGPYLDNGAVREGVYGIVPEEALPPPPRPEAGGPTDPSAQALPQGRPIEPEDYPTRWFTPEPGQVAGSMGLIAMGFALTMGIAKLGSRGRPTSD